MKEPSGQPESGNDRGEHGIRRPTFGSSVFETRFRTTETAGTVATTSAFPMSDLLPKPGEARLRRGMTGACVPELGVIIPPQLLMQGAMKRRNPGLPCQELAYLGVFRRIVYPGEMPVDLIVGRFVGLHTKRPNDLLKNLHQKPTQHREIAGEWARGQSGPGRRG